MRRSTVKKLRRCISNDFRSSPGLERFHTLHPVWIQRLKSRIKQDRLILYFRLLRAGMRRDVERKL